jgi:hypothetical protein
LSTAYKNNTQGYEGTTIDCTKGFYTECRCNGLGYVYPSENIYWSMDNRALIGTASQWNEIDFAEFLDASRGDFAVNEYINGGTLVGTVPAIVYFNIDSNFHVYGCLFLPPAGGNSGVLQFYLDGVHQPTQDVTIPTTGQLSVIPLQKLALKLMTDSNNNTHPFYVDYVRVWQLTASG